MKKFNEHFWTDDYDQEMLDFIKDNYNIWEDDLFPFSLSTGKKVLRYDEEKVFVVTCFEIGEYLTKQEFKEKIGMTNKDTFTKGDLVAGKHVVVYRSGHRRVVMYNGCLSGVDGNSNLENYNNELEHDRNSSMDIIEVYEICSNSLLKDLVERKNLKLVWKRTEKSEAQLQYEECQAKMKELQEQLDKLEPQIK